MAETYTSAWREANKERVAEAKRKACYHSEQGARWPIPSSLGTKRTGSAMPQRIMLGMKRNRERVS